MAIYTRTGDAGTTALFTGQRVSKTHPRVEAYGTLDELNAALSLCVCAAKNPQHRQLLENIQLQLFGSAPSWQAKANSQRQSSATSAQKKLPRWKPPLIPRWGECLPYAALFYGRSEAASRLHFARTLARRAERRLVELSTEISVRHVLMRYINRLSDCLYALARAEDHDAHQNNIIQKVAERYLAAIRTSATRSRLCLCLFRNSTNSLALR